MFHGLYRVSPSVFVFWLLCRPEFGCVKMVFDCMRIASRRNAEEETLNVHDTYGRISKGIHQSRMLRGKCCSLSLQSLPALSNVQPTRFVRKKQGHLTAGEACSEPTGPWLSRWCTRWPSVDCICLNAIFGCSRPFLFFLCFNVFWVHRYDENNGFLFSEKFLELS